MLDTPPEELTLSFTENVEVSLGAVRVYDGDGDRLDTGSAAHPDGDGSLVQAGLGELTNGSYVVTWRVTSADSHPIQGAFTFQVGPEATAADVSSLADRLLSEQGGEPAVGLAYGVDRFLVFASIALLLGGVFFVAVISPPSRSRAATRRLLWWAWAICVVATIAGIGLQGAYAAGLDLADAFRPSLYADVLETRFGKVSALRVLLLLVMLPVLMRLLARGPHSEHPIPTWWLPVAGLTGVALAATPGLGGHAGGGDLVPLALVADTLHVGAMSLWVGGLAYLTVVALPRRDVDEVRGAVTRFSRLALASVATIVVTGTFQAWRQVGSIEALRETDYGRILIVKLVVVAVLVVVAAFSREIVYRLYQRPARLEAARVGVSGAGDAGDGGGVADDGVPADGEEEPEVDAPRELRRLRGSVAVEVAIAVVVLVVTALLVNTNPAKDEIEGPYLATVRTEELSFEMTVAPAGRGLNDLHVFTLTPSEGPADVVEMTATMALPAQDIAPIDVPLRRLGPGHYLAEGFNIPIAGDWVLELSALVSATDEVTAETTVPIR